jgi:N-acetylglucosamine kinase-like BadF-type ATPase
MVLEQGELKFSLTTKGVKVTTSDPSHFPALLELEVAPSVDAAFIPIEKIIFYGAGSYGAGKLIADEYLKTVWPSADVTLYNDTVAEVNALCSSEPGFACIIGTGSNCTFFDGGHS